MPRRMLQSAGVLAAVIGAFGAGAGMFTAFAASFQISEPSVILEQSQTTFTVDLSMTETEAFAGAEFGLNLPSGVMLQSVAFGDSSVQAAMKTPQVSANGRQYFGFYTSDNVFSGTIDVAELTFSYTGVEDAVIRLGSSKVVRMKADGTTESDTASAPFEIRIARKRTNGSSGNGNSGSGGSSSSGGSSGSGAGSAGSGVSAGNAAGGPGAGAAQTGVWNQDSVGWWYRFADGSYPKQSWQLLPWEGAFAWYYFDETGYLKSGWFTDADGQVYYLSEQHDGTFGRMAAGWNKVGGAWQFFNDDPAKGTYGAWVKDEPAPDTLK